MSREKHHPLLQLAALLLSSTGIALATWIQTLAIVVGLYVAVGQLKEMNAQTQSPRNKQYDELMQKYDSDIGDALSDVRAVGAWARQGNWSEQELAKSIAELEARYGRNTRSIVEQQVKHLEGLLRCAARELCPPDKVKPFVCRDAGRTYHALDATPVPPAWTQQDVGRAMSSLQLYIDRHCGIFQRIGYYGLTSR